MAFKEIIQEEFEQLKKVFPKLTNITIEADHAVIAGEIDIIDINGYLWDTYKIEIIIFLSYPNSLPQLVETGKKIERHIDWHVSSKGICCLGTTAKIYRVLGRDINLLNWFEKFAYPFLANHHYRLETGNYANGEFSHGAKGLIEDYSELFEINDALQVTQYLKCLIGNKVLSKNIKCFCNSGKLYKRCYMLNRKEHFKGIPEFVVKMDLANLLTFSK
jgi:hypothetical protein